MNLNIKDLNKSMIVFCFLACSMINAQDTLVVDMETVLKIGNADNLTIEEYQLRKEKASAELEKSKSWWLPEIYAGVDTHQLWGAAMNGNGRFFIDVDRSNIWTGVGLNFDWDFAKGIYNTKIDRLEEKQMQYRSQAEKNKVLLEMIIAYYDFLSAQLQFQSYNKLIEQSDDISEQLKAKVESGIAYNSDVKMAQSNTNHLKIKMLESKNKYQRRSARLKELLNIRQDRTLLSNDTLVQPMKEDDFVLDRVNEANIEEHPEYQTSLMKLKVAEKEKAKITKGLLIPELQINAYAGYFGDLDGDIAPMDPVSQSEIQQVYQTNAINVSLLWKLPLRHLTHNGEIQSLDKSIDIRENQVKAKQIELDKQISQARESIANSKQQMQVAFEAISQAEEALNETIERQQAGTVRPYETLKAQEIFINSRLDYIKAIAQYNQAKYQLKVAKGEDL